MDNINESVQTEETKVESQETQKTVIVNLLYEVADEIFNTFDMYKKVSRLNDKIQENLKAYINTCVTLGSLPYRQTIYDGIEISQYEVIDCIKPLSHFVVKVGATSGEDEGQINHLKSIVAQVESKGEVDTRILSVEEFNRISAALSGALKCKVTHIERVRLSLAEAARLTYHASTGWVFGEMTYAPFDLDIAIMDEYATDNYRDFRRKFLVAMEQGIRGAQTGNTDKGAEQSK
jgi:hypothetical protein